MKDSVYMLVVDIWRLAARYGFRRMRDGEWESFIQDGEKLAAKYRREDVRLERLCRDMFAAFQELYQQIRR